MTTSDPTPAQQIARAAIAFESATGTVVKAFTTGTVVQVFLLTDGVPADSWSGSGSEV